MSSVVSLQATTIPLKKGNGIFQMISMLLLQYVVLYWVGLILLPLKNKDQGSKRCTLKYFGPLIDFSFPTGPTNHATINLSEDFENYEYGNI